MNSLPGGLNIAAGTGYGAPYSDRHSSRAFGRWRLPQGAARDCPVAPVNAICNLIWPSFHDNAEGEAAQHFTLLELQRRSIGSLRVAPLAS